MIYTSGSTGKPKGVMVTHANVRAFLSWRVAMVGAKPDEAFAHHTSFSFDASMDDLLTPLAAGASVHILSEDVRKDLQGLRRYLTDHAIVGLTLPTQFGMELLNGDEPLTLRYLMMGGEKLKAVKSTSVQVINGYGPTEFTVCSSYHVVDPDRDGDDIPIGRPVPGSVQAIVDAAGNLLPRGAVGELVLAGAQLTNGYWRRPDLTAEKFVALPWLRSADSGQKTEAYRTGDLARWNEKGELVYCGRVDNLVKLRGYRIEMGEIESAMAKFPGVASAVADVKRVNGVERLVGYYVEVRSAKGEVDEQSLREALAKSLADYMVPDAFVRLEKLPMTPNGKVDRMALPVPELAPAEMVAPATRAETRLLALARALMGTDAFGVTDRLRDYGLTSLLAIKLVTRAAKEGLTLKVGDILKFGTVRAICSNVRALGVWHDPYDPRKDVVVFVSGVTTYGQSAELLTDLAKTHNCFVFESLQDHYRYVFEGEKIDEVSALYLAFLDAKLPSGATVSAFAGHSFGGKLALWMAVGYAQRTGIRPRLVLWDTYLDGRAVEKGKAHLDELLERLPEDARLAFRAQYEALRIAMSVGALESPVYDAPTTYFRASHPENLMDGLQSTRSSHDERRILNEKALRDHLPNLTIVDVDADHFGILKGGHAVM